MMRTIDIATIKVELHDFVNNADDTELKAIYTAINESEKHGEWWRDEKLVQELNQRYADLKSGRDKGMTMDQATKHLLNRLK
jgi:hypothetical protein